MANLSTPGWSCVTGFITVDSGISSLTSAELETGGEMAMEVGEEPYTETVLEWEMKEQEKVDTLARATWWTENGEMLMVFFCGHFQAPWSV